MSNDGNPNRKFSQTFFLAEQPNGYFVLNDIFRYLKDDDDIEEGDGYDYVEDAAGDASSDAVEGTAIELTEEQFQDLSVKETASLEIETAQGEVEEPVTVELTATTTAAAIGVPVPEAINGSAESLASGASVQPATTTTTTTTDDDVAATATEPETEAEEPTAVPAAATAAPTAPASTASEALAAPPATPTTPSPEAEQQSVDQPAAAAAAAAVPPAVEEKPTPTSTPTPTPASAPAPAPAPAPVAPPTRPGTWAGVVAFNAKAATPATHPPPTAAAAPAAAPAAVQAPVPVTAPPPAPATPVTPTSSGGGAQWQMADSKRHSRAMTAGQTLAYVKNVTDAVSEKALKETLIKYGNLKFFEINRQKVPRLLYPDKACAHSLFFRIVPLWNLKLQRPSALPTVQTRT